MRPPSASRRNGFTIIEMLIVFAMISIMVAIAMPRARAVKDRANLRAARDQIAIALAAARASAVQKGQPSSFVMRNDSLWVALGADGTGQRIIGARYMKALYGASIVALPAGTTVLTYDSRGYVSTAGGLHIYRVTVAGMSDSVCVSKLGLTLKNGCLP